MNSVFVVNSEFITCYDTDFDTASVHFTIEDAKRGFREEIERISFEIKNREMELFNDEDYAEDYANYADFDEYWEEWVQEGMASIDTYWEFKDDESERRVWIRKFDVE